MKYKQQIKNNIHLIIAFTVLIAVSIFSSASLKESRAATPLEVDTIIPRGYVLVPVDLENKEAVQSLIQSHGIIDLYTGNPLERKTVKLATRIKIIRAPYNPNLFAVLVKEQLAERIMKQSGTFYAVIQNKAQAEASNDQTPSKNQRNITVDYQSEEN